MRTVGAFEAKNTLGTLLDLVESGEEVTITRHGKPVARLVGTNEHIDRMAARQAVERIKSMRNGVTLRGIPFRELIDDGRK